MSENKLLVSEYHLVWEALGHYEKYLENMSLSAANEDEELKYDDKLQDLQNAKKSIKYAALESYGLELSE